MKFEVNKLYEFDVWYTRKNHTPLMWVISSSSYSRVLTTGVCDHMWDISPHVLARAKKLPACVLVLKYGHIPCVKDILQKYYGVKI